MNEMLCIGLGLSSIVVGSGIALSLLLKNSKNIEESAPINNITITDCGNTTITNSGNTTIDDHSDRSIIIDEKEPEIIEVEVPIEKVVEVEKIVEKIVEVPVDKRTPIEDMYLINMHGMSFNKMYEPNPNYSPNIISSCQLRRTREYMDWIYQFRIKFRELKCKDEILANVNFNKKVRVEYAFVKYSKNDADNFIKSLNDTIVSCLGLTDDNNIEEIDVRVIENIEDYNQAKNLGKIYFKLSNIE
jgi:Holliday junction resolvase RusA-like endonuclease